MALIHILLQICECNYCENVFITKYKLLDKSIQAIVVGSARSDIRV